MLIKDLCAKSPFCLYVQGAGCATPFKVVDIDFEKECIVVKHKTNGICDGIGTLGFEDFKPYLRSLSSMTEEEGKEYITLLANTQESLHYIPDEKTMVEFVDWLNAHHFDYRGLIEKGLALEAPDGMYNKMKG